jgi:sugar lactone lactonase YvrE
MNSKHLLVLALAATACASAPKRPDVVWPPPPEIARIRFVNAIHSEEDVDTSGWARFRRTIIGDKSGIRLGQPMGLALSEDGQRLYVADFDKSQIVLIDLQNKQLKPFAPGQGFAQPFNVALDAEENVYVSDSGARTVARYDHDGNKIWSISDDLVRPTGLALDKRRQILYVADSARVDSPKHRVFAYDLKGHRLRQIGKERGPNDTEFHFPAYLAVDKDGTLYVGDTMNFRIQVFDPDGNFIKKFGEHGDSPGTFDRMKGMAFDGFGNLYVVDGGPSVVQMFNPSFQPLMFFGGFAPLLEYFDIPSCIAIEPRSNRIYVCNQQNARVNIYDLVNTRPEDAQAPSPSDNPKAAAQSANSERPSGP